MLSELNRSGSRIPVTTSVRGMPATTTVCDTSGPLIWPRTTDAARVMWAGSSGAAASGVAIEKQAMSRKKNANDVNQRRRQFAVAQ